ncbi:hypothetical protein G6L37_06115 [Agrobacterium rubi]|nr:hypothetical protein [Agrobacterium rubi]NTF24936.1 hypothetical protein [Agrobacterium rubi]
MNTQAQNEELLKAIKEFARLHHLNEVTIAAGKTPSDSEIDAEATAWKAVQTGVAACNQCQSGVIAPEIMARFSAGNYVFFDPAKKSFHEDDYGVKGAVRYEPTSWNYSGMDGFDKEAARIGRAAFHRLVELDLADDTSNDADEIIEALALLQAPGEL